MRVGVGRGEAVIKGGEAERKEECRRGGRGPSDPGSLLSCSAADGVFVFKWLGLGAW